MSCGHARQRRWNQPTSRGSNEADAHLADHFVSQGRNVGLESFHLALNTTGPADDRFAFLSRDAYCPVDEHHPELFLESSHMSGNIALYGMKRIGGGREAAVLCDGE